jgi:hypothetical protein
MWMPPKPVGAKEGWFEWYEGWKMWIQQGAMNAWYGRGGLNVKVCMSPRVTVWEKEISWRTYS